MSKKKTESKTDHTPDVQDLSDAAKPAAGEPAPKAGIGKPLPAGIDPVAADRMAADLAAAMAEGGQPPSPDPHEALRAALELAKDRELRAHAELDNYRKRIARETQEERRYASLPLLRDLLPVMDNLDRAIQSAEKTLDAAGLLQGVKMVAGQLASVLARHHCAPIQALHKPFDPHLHEAILQQPSADHPAGTVLQVTQSGYRVHDRVVRPSQVIVSLADPIPETPESPKPTEADEKNKEC